MKKNLTSGNSRIPRPSLASHKSRESVLSAPNSSRLTRAGTGAPAATGTKGKRKGAGITKKNTTVGLNASSKVLPYSELKRREEQLREQVKKLNEEMEDMRQVHEIRMQQVGHEQQELEWNHESQLTDLQRASEKKLEQIQEMQRQLEEERDEKEQVLRKLNKFMKRFDSLSDQLEPLGIDPVTMTKLTEKHELLEEEQEERKQRMEKLDQRIAARKDALLEERTRWESLIRKYDQQSDAFDEESIMTSIMETLNDEQHHMPNVDPAVHRSVKEWLQMHSICFDKFGEMESQTNGIAEDDSRPHIHTPSDNNNNDHSGEGTHVYAPYVDEQQRIPSSEPTSPTRDQLMMICDEDE